MSRPQRAYTLSIEIGADTWDDVVRDLRELAGHVPDHGPTCASVSGSPSGGHIVTVKHRPDMTHDRYMAELEAYLATRGTATDPAQTVPADDEQPQGKEGAN
jgi:hypothetical protein